MNKISELGVSLSFLAVGVAACCVLPMTLMLFGLSGSWIAVFGEIAKTSVPVLTLSAVLISIGWAMAYSRGVAAQQKWLLGSATFLTGLAWLVYLNEATINTQLIEMM